MRKIVVEVEMSLDGCIGGEDNAFWNQVMAFHTEDVVEYLDNILYEPEALLIGEKTFNYFAKVWPQRKGKQADRINTVPKYVASRTLKEPLEWNGTLLKGSVVEEIKKLKQQTGKNLLQYGVGELTHTMLQHGLVDELRVLVFPFSYDSGPHIFDHMGVNVLELLETKTFKSGAVALSYRPQNAK